MTGILSIAAPLAAQPEKSEIVTDRPDQSNTPVIIPKGSLQIEAGSTIEQDRSGIIEQTNITFNSTLIKYGVNDHFELRFSTGYLSVSQSEAENRTDRGFSPAAIGAKVKLADENGPWPQAAVISHVYLKTGSKVFKPRYTPFDICFSFAHQLSNLWSLTYNGGALWNGESPETTFTYTVSNAVTLTSRLSLFVECYGFLPENHKASNRMDGGFTYKITPVLQWDISGGYGLSKNAPDYFLSSGISFRLLK